MGHVSDAEFVVADTCTSADASSLVERIRAAVSATPSRSTLSIGAVAVALDIVRCIRHDDVLDEAVAVASAAMREARTTGGDAVRYRFTDQLGMDEGTDDSR